MLNTLKIIVAIWIIMSVLFFRELIIFIKEEKKKNERNKPTNKS